MGIRPRLDSAVGSVGHRRVGLTTDVGPYPPRSSVTRISIRIRRPPRWAGSRPALMARRNVRVDNWVTSAGLVERYEAGFKSFGWAWVLCRLKSAHE